MSYRYMRVIIFFDLPTQTHLQRRAYRKFRKFLIQEGFIMMQESVYSKIALNPTAAKNIQNKVHKNKTSTGLIQMLTITEKQYSSIEYVIGENHCKVVNQDTRMVIF